MKKSAENRGQTESADVGFFDEIFSESEDKDRYYGSLLKLRRHIKGQLSITGGIGVNAHLLKNGLRRKTKLNDIDVVVEDLSCLNVSLGKDFLIRHFHPYRVRGRILIMLIDEEYRTRIDVFTPTTKTLSKRLTDFHTGNLLCSLVSVEDLTAKLLSVVYPIIEGETIEPKYAEHFDLLYAIADLKTAEAIWDEYRKESQQLSFEDATNAVRQSIREKPKLLQKGYYSHDINEACQWCVKSEAFPLAPLSRIYEILGYV